MVAPIEASGRRAPCEREAASDASEPNLTSPSIFISGGTSGVGLRTALDAVERGFRVYVTGRDPRGVRRAIDEVGDAEKLSGRVADAADPVQTESAVAEAVARFGALDAVIANAGLGGSGDFGSGDPEEWRQMVLTNVLGPALLIRASLPFLQASSGHVVLIGSVLGRYPKTGSLYGATKTAVTAMGESLRQQLVGSGVRVCVVQPGRIDTRWWPDGPGPAALQDSDVARTVLWVLEQPAGIDVNEVVVRAVGQRG